MESEKRYHDGHVTCNNKQFQLNTMAYLIRGINNTHNTKIQLQKLASNKSNTSDYALWNI